MSDFFKIEKPSNFEQKSLCILLLDISISMEGTKIESLNKGVEAFYNEIKQDPVLSNRLELCIISYESIVKVIQQPALVENINLPKLYANGITSMGEGIDIAIDVIEARKSWYKQTGQPYYRPWIINITDGYPTDMIHNGIETYGNTIRKNVDEKNFFFFNIGVEYADMKKLQLLSSSQMPPAKLKGLKFVDFFQWLSASIQMVNASSDKGDNTVNLPSPENWMQGFEIS